MKTQEQIINQGKVSNFDEFLTENRKAINKQFALAMRVLVLLGPIIAIMVKLNMFMGVTFNAAIYITVYVLVLTIIQDILLRRHEDSILASLITLLTWGSTFSFDLEQKVVVWDQIGDYEQSYKDRRKTRERYKEKLLAPNVNVLVVDDNKVNLMMFRLLVKNTQVQTDTAESGDECLKKASEKTYDIIFLDHMMPGKDGTETLHELRQINGPNHDTPVICLTADAISGAREQYISVGFTDYLTKPINPELLEEMLIEMLPKEKITLIENK